MSELPTRAGNHRVVPQVRWLDAISVISLCGLIAAFTLPWLLPKKSDGFASAAEGALLFLVAMGLALVCGAAACILAWRWRSALTSTRIVLACTPLPLAVIALTIFIAYAIMRSGA